MNIHGSIRTPKMFKNVSGGPLTLQCLRAIVRRQRLTPKMRERLRLLKRREFVRERRIGKRLILELTDKGRCRLMRVQMRREPLLPPREHVRVEYDFPETQHRARDTFRYFLKTGGFTCFQQSIWICRRDVYNILCAFIREHDLGDWVDVIRGRPAEVPRRRSLP